MNQIELNKYKEIIKNKNTCINNSNKKIKKSLIKTSIVVILFLSLAIAYKSNDYLKDKIVKYIYTEDISFSKINKFYNKYLGGLLPLKNNINTEEVFNESLKYDDLSIYYDGVKLTVSENYLVPSLKEGMVVFVGEKENYGNTIIIEDLDGVDIWYGNVNSTSLKLYDYIEEGALIGEVTSNLYLVFSKEDKYLNYEEYIS
ncbi:MAG: M23 family metallopeptidase [Bacilli bacterium]|nr:M23 family metallopeptidase [Bacilli bacterium]